MEQVTILGLRVASLSGEKPRRLAAPGARFCTKTSAFAIMLPLVSVPWLLSLTDETRLAGLTIWALAMLYAVWTFTRFAKRKTKGEWLWRWNGKPYREILEEKAKE